MGVLAPTPAEDAAAPAAGIDTTTRPLPTRGLLLRYRVLAFTTATLLIVLVFVGVPLQVAAGRPGVANVVGTCHGLLYVAYLVVAWQLTRRLAVPRGRMLLVLAAGTVPFCAFVAERKMTRRFAAVTGEAGARPRPDRAAPRARWRQRWATRRALGLHLALLVVAPACLVAGWWQVTRALHGNGLSWVYSVEWPIFAALAAAGWWHLIHEDPEAYRARRQRAAPDLPGAVGRGPVRDLTVDEGAARLATALAIGVGVEFAVGIATLVLVPFRRPDGWTSGHGAVVLGVHSVLGVPLGVGAVVLLRRTTRGPRLGRLSGLVGATGVGLAGLGGLASASHPLRVAGMVVMFVGAVVAGFGYVLPALERLERGQPPPSASGIPDGLA